MALIDWTKRAPEAKWFELRFNGFFCGPLPSVFFNRLVIRLYEWAHLPDHRLLFICVDLSRTDTRVLTYSCEHAPWSEGNHCFTTPEDNRFYLNNYMFDNFA